MIQLLVCTEKVDSLMEERLDEQESILDRIIASQIGLDKQLLRCHNEIW